MTDTRSNLTHAMFADRVGAIFHVRLDADQLFEVKLTEVTELPVATTRDDIPVRRDPFSLIFKSDTEDTLEQGPYAVQHDALGTMDMFFVPVGFGEYQVIFN